MMRLPTSARRIFTNMAYFDFLEGKICIPVLFAAPPCILVSSERIRLNNRIGSLEANAISIEYLNCFVFWYQKSKILESEETVTFNIRFFHRVLKKMSGFRGFDNEVRLRPSIEGDEEEDESSSSSSLFMPPITTPPDPDLDMDEDDEEQQSPNYEPPDVDDDDEEELERAIEQEEPDLKRRNTTAPAPERFQPSSRPRVAPPVPDPSGDGGSASSTSNHVVIPSNGFAPAFECALLAKLNKYAGDLLPHPLPVHFAHLNCFHLTHPHTCVPPTVIQLKQHAQAVCLLLNLLQPSKNKDVWPNAPANPPFPVRFDFLNDLTDPYPSGSTHANRGVLLDFHQKPLRGLSNTLESGHPGIGDIERCTKPELLAHANKLLTRLDHVYRLTGGILSIPPPPPDDDESGSSTGSNETRVPTGLARNSILAQWLGYTRALTLRLASLEKETASLREVLGHEALVAKVRGKQAREKMGNGEGCGERELVYPQDRYVLAGLSEGLWTQLNEELTVREGENREEREHEREEREQGRGVQGRGWGDFAAPEADDDGETNVVTWIETTSRLYRVRGHDTIFVIPGFGVHPGAPAVHRVERGPLVQTVPERRVVDGDWANVGATAWERDVAALAKDRDNHIQVLESAVAQLKRELETEKTNRRRLVAEAELKGRRAARDGEGRGLGIVEGRGKQRER